MENIRTDFGVWPRYEFIDVSGERHVGMNQDDLDRLGEEALKMYSLDLTQSIFSHFSSIKSESELLKFVKQYGLVGINRDINKQLLQPVVAHMESESVSACLKEANEMKYLIDLWNNPYNLFRKIIIPAGTEIGIKRSKKADKDIEFNPFEIISLPLLKRYFPVGISYDNATLARIYVVDSVASKITGLKPTIKVTSHGEIIPAFHYNFLIDAIWHQLYIDLTSPADFKTCPYCQAWHTGRSKFCPPPPFIETSQCKASFDRIKHRKWLREVLPLLNAGKSIIEVARQSRVPQHLIHYWIDQEKNKGGPNQ